MKSKIQISIPTPCHENWQNMAVADKGRFCASCQKSVIDFTKSSDREIVKAFDNNKSLCGRFNDSQLNRELFVPKEKNTVWIAAASGILAFLGIGNHITNAQPKAKSEIVKPKPTIGNLREIKGIVTYDSIIPLEHVSISVYGSKRKTVSDSNGRFSIHAKTGEKLLFSITSMKTDEIVIDDQSGYHIDMDYIATEPAIINAVSYSVTTGAVQIIQTTIIEQRKRTFFGRLFHSISNLFR